jgi:membrane protease YdiL (CAAX protease family)
MFIYGGIAVHSVQQCPLKPWSLLGLVGLTLAIVLAQVIGPLLVMAVLVAVTSGRFTAIPDWLSTAAILVGIWSSFAAASLFRARSGNKLLWCGQEMGWTGWGISIATAAGCVVALQMAALLFPGAIGSSTQQQLIETALQTGPLATLLFSAVVIAAPAWEEWVLRGMIQPLLTKRWGVWPAIAITGLLFGVIHMEWRMLIPTALCGIVFGWLVHKRRSVARSFVAHAAFNLNKREFPHLYRRRDESLYLAGIGTVLVE